VVCDGDWVLTEYARSRPRRVASGSRATQLGSTSESLELVTPLDFIGPVGGGGIAAQPYSLEVDLQVQMGGGGLKGLGLWESRVQSVLYTSNAEAGFEARLMHYACWVVLLPYIPECFMKSRHGMLPADNPGHVLETVSAVPHCPCVVCCAGHDVDGHPCAPEWV
jgi:hypothetical protein